MSTPDLFILHLEIADEDDGFEPPPDSILLFALPAGTDAPEAIVSRPRDVAVQVRVQRLPQAPADAFLP